MVEVLSREPRLVPQAATVFQGHAVWSSDQLMSEVARGSWGLVRATDEDLKLLDGDPEDRWAALWQDRAVLQREGSDSRPDARATSVRRGHDEGEEREERGTANPTAGCIGLGACIIA